MTRWREPSFERWLPAFIGAAVGVYLPAGVDYAGPLTEADVKAVVDALDVDPTWGGTLRI